MRLRRLLLRVLLCVGTLLLVDVAVVLPTLLALGFYFRSSGTIAAQLHDEQLPNNLQPHPRFLWHCIPGSRYSVRSSTENASYEVAINADGFRDEEPTARPAGAVPFVALGDSFTFGWLVEHRDRWDEQLVAMLRAQGIEACSENLGMWAATFDQHALILEEHAGPACRAVIHLVYPSHVQTITRHRLARSGGTITAVFDPLLHVKDQQLFYGAGDDALVAKRLGFPFLWCWVQHAWNRQRLQEWIRTSADLTAPTDDLLLYRAAEQGPYERGWQNTEAALHQTADFCRRRGLDYLVVLVPRDVQLHEREWNGKPADAEILEGSLPQRRLQQICARAGIACLDLLAAMRSQYSDALYFQADPHWRPGGHRFAANAIVEQLRTSGWLDAWRRPR